MVFEGFPPTADVSFDRRISPTLLAALAPRGPFGSLVERSRAGRGRFDVQLRREPKGTTSWASFYVGLTTVLNIDERNRQYRLRAHGTHRGAGDFDENWSTWSDERSLAACWPDVERYLDRVIAAVPERYTRAEGAVHGAICCGSASTYCVVQREASPAFRDTSIREAISNSIATPLYEACDFAIAAAGKPAWWPGVRDHGKHKPLGTGLDVLAIGTDGALLVIEAKDSNALAGIVWGPAQARFYAELFARWIAEPIFDEEVIEQMLAQRVALGLASSPPQLRRPIEILPMLVIGTGAVSPAARERTTKVADVIETVPRSARVVPTQIWRIDAVGTLTEQWR